MSSQGSLVQQKHSFEHQLLEGWGNWARGDASLWFSRLELLGKLGLGFCFAEEDLERADRIIAGLAPAQKSVLKKVYIALEGGTIEEGIKTAAVAAFAESLERDGEERRR